MTLSRRALALGLGAVAALPRQARSQGGTSDVPDTVDFAFLPPHHPNLIFAQRVAANRIETDTLFTEPSAMLFQVTGYSDADMAAQAFPDLNSFMMAEAEKALDTSASYPYDEVSIGPLGDDRRAFQAESRETVFESTAKDLRVFILHGSNILHVLALSFGGETVEFVAEFLGSFLEGADRTPESLLPRISDLPVGWQLQTEEPQDVLNLVVQEPTSFDDRSG